MKKKVKKLIKKWKEEEIGKKEREGRKGEWKGEKSGKLDKHYQKTFYRGLRFIFVSESESNLWWAQEFKEKICFAF